VDLVFEHRIKVPSRYIKILFLLSFFLGYAVAQLIEALSYKPEDRGFNSRWSHLDFSLT
jgi:hypothetical protein